MSLFRVWTCPLCNTTAMYNLSSECDNVSCAGCYVRFTYTEDNVCKVHCDNCDAWIDNGDLRTSADTVICPKCYATIHKK